MRTASDIYTEFRIMPSLQLHQLRAAAVGSLICDAFGERIESRDVVLACLFHDMGNIIKSDLTVFPDMSEPEGVEYWQGVKGDFIAKYGSNEFEATMRIADEIGLSIVVQQLIEGVSFARLEWTRDHASLEQRVVEYCDLRVGPYGVLPMIERIEEARVRYRGRHSDMPEDLERFEELASAAASIEARILADANIRAEDIDDAAVAPRIEELKCFQVD